MKEEGIETVDNVIKLLIISLFLTAPLICHERDFYFHFIRFFVNEAY